MKVTDLGQVTLLPIDDIKPASNNPRTIPARAVELVAYSLKEFGWQQPLVVDAQHILIAGHTRWQAARSLGLKQCPVVVAEGLTDEQVRAYRIADNRTHDYTTWDYTELVAQLEELSPSFSDVLGLADWGNIVDTFNNLESDDFGVDLPDDVIADLKTSFAVIVVFRDKTTALEASPILLDMDGVIDVRHKETRK